MHYDYYYPMPNKVHTASDIVSALILSGLDTSATINKSSPGFYSNCNLDEIRCGITVDALVSNVTIQSTNLGRGFSVS
ncbi:hypothetical protein NVP1031O_041 [Vibrio phage 1.031.O._10N.261.46.F8]|nr:hypothetical protein NVP1031O_041 [Vibrio phage 1.031.O._10N.261.46.F8]CAH9017139.1 conserved hypothetical protein [Vibrio phage 150E35-1]